MCAGDVFAAVGGNKGEVQVSNDAVHCKTGSKFSYRPPGVMGSPQREIRLGLRARCRSVLLKREDCNTAKREMGKREMGGLQHCKTGNRKWEDGENGKREDCNTAKRAQCHPLL